MGNSINTMMAVAGYNRKHWQNKVIFVFNSIYRILIAELLNILTENRNRLMLQSLGVKCDYHIVFCPEYRFRMLSGIVKDLLGNHFWPRAYFVNTIGINEDMILRYVKYQEDQDKKEESNGEDFTLFD